MKPEALAALSRWFHARSGVVITPDKLYLVENRLAPVARRHAIGDLETLVDAACAGAEPLAAEVADALLCLDTAFFRDQRPFQRFRDELLPRLLDARAATRRLRVWSAGCSTGQEPYSIAMLLDELGDRLLGWRVEILATDLSRPALERARTGAYSAFEAQRGVPIRTLLRHFVPEGDRWQLSAAMRERVLFQPFNLLDDPTPLGRFDAVFCRNVLTFFDLPTRCRVLAGIARILAPDGALLLGRAETVVGASDRFAPVAGAEATYALAPESEAAGRAAASA